MRLLVWLGGLYGSTAVGEDKYPFFHTVFFARRFVLLKSESSRVRTRSGMMFVDRCGLGPTDFGATLHRITGEVASVEDRTLP
jgi:predicted ATPase